MLHCLLLLECCYLYLWSYSDNCSLTPLDIVFPFWKLGGSFSVLKFHDGVSLCVLIFIHCSGQLLGPFSPKMHILQFWENFWIVSVIISSQGFIVSLLSSISLVLCSTLWDNLLTLSFNLQNEVFHFCYLFNFPGS